MRKFLVGAAVVAIVAAACSKTETPGASSAPPTSGSVSVDPCAVESLNLKTPATMAIGTDNPAFQPWFGGSGSYGDWKANPGSGTGNPASGKGYESAFSYALAAQMGFDASAVTWVYTDFNNSFKPGPKDFDFDINEISYKPKRAEAVSFSDSYYDVSQALVAKQGTPIASATTVADLKPYKLGAQIGTTSLDTITDVIQPDQDPSVYDRSTDVIQAFNNGQIDGYIVDAPTAYVNVLIGEAHHGVVVGQFPSQGEYFGLVFEKDNPLVDCVNQAIAALTADGTIAALQAKWLTDVTFPVFG